jgi:ABC-type branched-subunit amino acid transport system permease subunit
VIFAIRDLIRSRIEDLLQVRGGEYELIIYGVILAVMMIFMPEGLTFGIVNLVHRARHGQKERDA